MFISSDVNSHWSQLPAISIVRRWQEGGVAARLEWVRGTDLCFKPAVKDVSLFASAEVDAFRWEGLFTCVRSLAVAPLQSCFRPLVILILTWPHSVLLFMHLSQPCGEHSKSSWHLKKYYSTKHSSSVSPCKKTSDSGFCWTSLYYK